MEFKEKFDDLFMRLYFYIRLSCLITMGVIIGGVVFGIFPAFQSAFYFLKISKMQGENKYDINSDYFIIYYKSIFMESLRVVSIYIAIFYLQFLLLNNINGVTKSILYTPILLITTLTITSFISSTYLGVVVEEGIINKILRSISLSILSIKSDLIIMISLILLYIMPAFKILPLFSFIGLGFITYILFNTYEEVVSKTVSLNKRT